MADRGRGPLSRKRERAADALAEANAAAPKAAAAAPSGRICTTSALFGLLVYLWSWGFLSLPLAQKIAAASCTDLENARAPPYQDLLQMSKIGHSGSHPHNMQRDLVGHLAEPRLSMPFVEQLPLTIAPQIVAARFL